MRPFGNRCAIAALVSLPAALAGCGGGGDTETTATTGAPRQAPEPAASVTLRSDDDRPRNRETIPDSGARTTLRGRVALEGAPVARERVQLLADPHPFGDGEEVVAGAVTRRDGRFVVRAPFGRETEVRARLAGDEAAVSPAVSIHRTVRLDDGEIDDRPDGTIRFTGVMAYPRDIAGDFRFAFYVGLATDRRLARRPARVRVTELRPGRSRVAMTFRAPEGWRMRLCVFPAKDSGLSQPRGTCRGRSIPNVDPEGSARREREARLRERDAGGGAP